MKSFFVAIASLFLFVAGAHAAWNLADAVADSERDIRAGKLRFYFVGSFVPTAPDVPTTYKPLTRRYPHRYAGGPGCTQTSEAQHEYARRYNERLVAYFLQHKPSA